jgi:hypothetical protein
MNSLRLGLVAVGIESVLMIVVLSLEPKVQTLSAGIGLAFLQFPAVVATKNFTDWYYSSHHVVLPMVVLNTMMFVIQAFCIWIALICGRKIIRVYRGAQT